MEKKIQGQLSAHALGRLLINQSHVDRLQQQQQQGLFELH